MYRELKALSDEDISSFCIYGGSAYEPQESAIARGLDVVVGTPGRILEHINRGTPDQSLALCVCINVFLSPGSFGNMSLPTCTCN